MINWDEGNPVSFLSTAFYCQFKYLQKSAVKYTFFTIFHKTRLQRHIKMSFSWSRILAIILLENCLFLLLSFRISNKLPPTMITVSISIYYYDPWRWLKLKESNEKDKKISRPVSLTMLLIKSRKNDGKNAHILNFFPLNEHDILSQ